MLWNIFVKARSAWYAVGAVIVALFVAPFVQAREVCVLNRQ